MSFVLSSIPLPDDRTDSYLMGIKREMEDATQMVITIVPTNRKDRYDSIKKLCCLERPGIACTLEDCRSSVL